jgi:thiol-disulfide isomerase/thioredoxin
MAARATKAHDGGLFMQARNGFLLAFALVLAGCAARIPKDARTTTVSLDRLDCAECGERLAAKLRERNGIYAAAFDRRRGELTVTASPSLDPLAEAAVLSKGESYTLAAGAGHGGYVAWQKPAEGVDVATIGKDGVDVPDLAPHLVRGKITVVDFSAVWCAPCRKVDEHVLAMLGSRADVAYRKLDIGDWDTPLAARWLRGVPSLPYVLVYDKAGRRVDAIAGLDLARLDAAIARAGQ